MYKYNLPDPGWLAMLIIMFVVGLEIIGLFAALTWIESW
ncbi:hypothetical protein LCGC14_0316150 [marine sediment metagenome]|uniref:Uncharacterized protein n=1 Tax=marine sediment metagenome TaxID=412755 RepID=A0A0F9WSC8_9ZZZZ